MEKLNFEHIDNVETWYTIEYSDGLSATGDPDWFETHDTSETLEGALVYLKQHRQLSKQSGSDFASYRIVRKTVVTEVVQS